MRPTILWLGRNFIFPGWDSGQFTEGEKASFEARWTVSVLETAPPGEAAEKSGVHRGHSLPYTESQAPLQAHKSPIIGPNRAISALAY